MVLVFRLFIGVYKVVLLKSRYRLDLVTGFVFLFGGKTRYSVLPYKGEYYRTEFFVW